MNSFIRLSIFSLILTLLSSAIALAAWKHDEPLAYNGSPLTGSSVNTRISVNPVTNRVGIAYVDSGSGALTFAEWQSGSGIVAKENIAASGTAVLGLAYDSNGLPRVGAIGKSNICEYVKQADGSWKTNDTGILSDTSRVCGSYALNPASGTGAFFAVTKDDAKTDTPLQAAYIDYKDGNWRATNYDSGDILTTSLAFTTSGIPFVLWGKAIVSEFIAMTWKAGDATPGASNLQDITPQYVYQRLSQAKVAIDPVSGEIWIAYVLADYTLGPPNALVGRKWTGKDWTAVEAIDINSDMNGDMKAQLGFVFTPSQGKVLMYPTPTGGEGGINIAYWDQSMNVWKTELLPQRGDASGLDLGFDIAGNIYGLYNSLSDDQFHLLTGYTPPASLYAKVKMKNQTEPCVIHIFGYKTNQTFTPHCQIWETGMHVDETATRYPEKAAEMLQGDEESPWVDLSPLLLSPWGENCVKFYATQDMATGYDAGVSPTEFTISFSSTPSDEGVLKSFTRSGPGCGMMVSIDLTKLDQLRDDLENSQLQNDMARALPPTPGRPPKKFPIMTMSEIKPHFFQTKTLENELDTLTRLGINDLEQYEPYWYNAGFKHFSWGSNYRYDPYIIDNDRSNLDLPLIDEFVKAEAKKAIDTGHADDITLWTLYDEPSSMFLSHIIGCPVCQSKFRIYLQGLGYTPAFFGADSWDKVYPSGDKAKQPKLYYHSLMFRCQILVDLFKAGTNSLLEVMPNVPTTANFCEEPTLSGSMLHSGVDQFAMFEQGGLRLGWSESWLVYVSTNQLAGHIADFLRSAVRDYGTGKFGMYNCHSYGKKIFWENATKMVSEIGHGASQINEYNWGPSYAMAVDRYSGDKEWYAALQIANNAVGAVEDYLVDAKVAKNKVAIIYSQATDIWEGDFLSGDGWGNGLTGHDTVGLWLILRHLGYPVDFVQEKDVAAGKLTKENYKMVICDATHLLRTALPPLMSWLKAGGVLYMGPGSLTYDQYNVPLDFDKQAGISRQAFVFKEKPGWTNPEITKRNSLLPVTYSNEKLEAICGYQKMKSTPKGAKVHSTFEDGSAAVWTKSVGKGKLQFSGFFPGLGYEKAAVIALQARDKADPEFPMQGATEWPEAHRALFATLLSPVADTRPVTTSHYLLEANRLEAPMSHPGSLIAITNWTGKPLTDVKITLPRNGMNGTPTTVINPIKNHKTENGALTVTIDMNGPVDFLVVPKSN